MNIAINGFGRIGKNFLRCLLLDKKALQLLNVAVINIGPTNKENLAHLFKYDTLMGTYPGDVRFEHDYLIIDTKKIRIIAQADAEKLDWRPYSVDWVVDCSGKFTKREMAQKHLAAGAKKVLISAPAHDDDVSIVPGVNQTMYDAKKHAIVSLGSCTTNACMPMLKVLHETFGIQNGFITTVHAYTNSQALLDSDGNDPRLSRAAALNIIPAGTGASKMVEKIMPELGNKIAAASLRVPVGKVSIVDVIVNVEKKITEETINKAFAIAQNGSLKNILRLTHEPLVSSDCAGTSYSVIVDAQLTTVSGNLAKASGWYDNEWAYSLRLKDFLVYVESLSK